MSVVITNTMMALRLMENQFSVPNSRFSVKAQNQQLRTENRELRTVLLLLRGQHRIRGSSVFFKLVMQRLQADAENLGGAGLVITGRLQSFQDELFLGLFHGRAYAQMDGVGVMNRGTNILAESGGQVLGLDQAAFTNDDGALQSIAQLTDVAGPGIALEKVQHRLADIRHLAFVFLVHLREQGPYQFADIVLVIAQRRHMNIEDIETVIKILAQFSFLDCLVGNLVGGGEDTD